MKEFVLSQAELVVLAKVVLKIPAPPLGMPPEPELAKRPFDEVVIETLAQLLEKGWVQVEDDGTPKVHPELAAMLRAAGYLEAWMTVLLHEHGEHTIQQVGFYWDGQQVVQHELDLNNHTHIFRPGPKDMGYAWVKEQVEQFAASDTSQELAQPLVLSHETWEFLFRARLEGEEAAVVENLQADLAPEARELAQDILTASLLMQLNCLPSVYAGEQWKETFLLGPTRNWRLWPGPCGEGETSHCLQAQPMNRAALQRALHVLWSSFELSSPEPGPEAR